MLFPVFPWRKWKINEHSEHKQMSSDQESFSFLFTCRIIILSLKNFPTANLALDKRRISFIYSRNKQSYTLLFFPEKSET